MLYTITVASPEVEDFVRELMIESDATFHDLHSLIRQACQWGKGDPAAFHICDHNWHRERTIPEDSYELDIMDDVELGDVLEDEGQRMKYIFDPKARRMLLLEVTHISYGKHIDEPTCRRQRGEAPALSEELPAFHTQDTDATANMDAPASTDATAPHGPAFASNGPASSTSGSASGTRVHGGFPAGSSASNADLLAQLTAAALALNDDDAEDNAFNDDEGFDPEELDPEGFDITEM